MELSPVDREVQRSSANLNVSSLPPPSTLVQPPAAQTVLAKLVESPAPSETASTSVQAAHSGKLRMTSVECLRTSVESLRMTSVESPVDGSVRKRLPRPSTAETSVESPVDDSVQPPAQTSVEPTAASAGASEGLGPGPRAESAAAHTWDRSAASAAVVSAVPAQAQMEEASPS